MFENVFADRLRPLLLLGALLAGSVVAPCRAVAEDAVAGSDASTSEPVFSGPQPGETLPPLRVRNVFVDPPVDVEVVAEKSERPVLLIFFHKRTRPAFGLMNALVRFAKSRGDRLHSHVAVLTPDVTETSDWLQRIKPMLPDPGRYGLSTDGAEGPGAYGLNRDVTLTVIVGNKGRATASFALVQPSLETDGNKILKAVLDVLGDDEKPDIARFANPNGQAPAMRRPNAPSERGAQDERLTAMLREAIQRDAKPDDVTAIVQRINEYVAKNDAAREQLGGIAARIVAAKRVEMYGTEPVQKAIRQWAEKYGPRPASDESNRPTNERDSVPRKPESPQ